MGAARLLCASTLLPDWRGLMTNADSGLVSGPSEELGRALTRLRNERGLTQKQVANLAEIDNSTLSRLESGEKKKRDS